MEVVKVAALSSLWRRTHQTAMALLLLLCVPMAAPVRPQPSGVAEQRGEVIAQLTWHFRLKTVLLLRGADRHSSCNHLS